MSTLFAEAGQPNYLIGAFEESTTRAKESGTLNEARWLLRLHRREGITRLLSSTDQFSSLPPPAVILTGHAIGPGEQSELERITRALCKVLPEGASLTYTGLCKPNFTGRVLRQIIEKQSGHTIGREIQLSYMPLCWGGETMEEFREKPKLIAGFGEGTHFAQEIFFSIFPSISTSPEIGTAEAAGLFGPIYRDVLRALELELAALCQVDNIDYSNVLELSRQTGTDALGIPRAFVGRDALASNIVINSAGRQAALNVVRAARRVNQTGEQKVLDLVKDALALCGKRFRHSRVAILGFAGLESARNTRPSAPQVVQTLERRGVILSVYPGRDDRWFKRGVLSDKIRVENTPLKAVSKASCALLALDHWDFAEISPQKLALEMSHPAAICDLARVMEASNVERAGLFYTSIGRGSSGT